MHTMDGETKSVADWCRQYGRNYHTTYLRVRRGWSIYDALFTPNLGRRKLTFYQNDLAQQTLDKIGKE